MEKIKIGDKTYKLNIEKAKELGLIEEESIWRYGNYRIIWN